MHGGPSLPIKKIKITKIQKNKMKNEMKKFEKIKKYIIQKKNPQRYHGP